MEWLRLQLAEDEPISELPATHASSLATLMTLNFQQFENASLISRPRGRFVRTRHIKADRGVCQLAARAG
jgi:hypothetical protein